MRLMAMLTYGCGLRLSECLNLRVKDLDLERGMVVVRSGKGDKDRRTVLPERLRDDLAAHLQNARELFDLDRQQQLPGVFLPKALERKYPNAGKEWSLVLGLSCTRRFDRPPQRDCPPALPAPEHVSARLSRGGSRRRHHQVCHRPCPAPLLRHPPAGGGHRHPHHPGSARSFRSAHHHDLHPCRQQKPLGRRQSPRPFLSLAAPNKKPPVPAQSLVRAVGLWSVVEAVRHTLLLAIPKRHSSHSSALCLKCQGVCRNPRRNLYGRVRRYRQHPRSSRRRTCRQTG